MKLKKIASLALAGVMAVSMLAGCGTNNGGSSDNGNTVVEPATTTILDALNNGQDAKNEVKVTFTSDSNLDAALAAAAAEVAADTNTIATPNNATLVTNLTNRLSAHKAITLWNQTSTSYANNFYNDSTIIAFNNNRGVYTSRSENADVVLTKAYIVKSGNAWTEEAAVLQAVDQMDEDIAKLKADDVVDNKVHNALLSTTNNKYHTYDYTGNVSMVSKENVDGTVYYYVVMTITQSITEVEYKA